MVQLFKMKSNLTVLIVTLVCLTVFPVKSSQHLVKVSLVTKQKTPNLHKSAQEVNSLGVRLLAHLASHRKEENVVFSPFSIAESLRILLLGAKGNSAREISKALGITTKQRNKKPTFYRTFIKTLQSKKKNGDVLLLANKLWVREGFPLHKSFKSKANRYLKADVGVINFKDSPGARKLVNSWQAKLKGPLKDLLSDSDISMDTNMLLTSTLYFKGKWKQKFIPQQGKFHYSGSNTKKSKQVKMMYTTGNFHYTSCPRLKSRAVDLPYSGGKNLSMVIILPDKYGGLKDLQKKLDYKEFKECLGRLDRESSVKEVDVSLPRFRLREKLELSESLRSLGIKDVFDYGKVNLTGITSDKVYLSAMFHQADVRVDQHGTEADAATTVEISERAVPQEFDANHPFLFFIREKKFGTVILVGAVHRPTK